MQFAHSAMVEQDRAIAMGERARDIVDLIDQLGLQSVRQSSLARLPGPIPRPEDGVVPAAMPMASALADQRRLPYRLPVSGQLLTGLGEVSASGARERGLTFRTRPGAIVVAPRAGRIVFAGPFQGYGQIIIIDHGRGWTTLLAHLQALDVRVGQNVIDGGPVGRTAGQMAKVTVELRRHGRPVDITSLVA